MSRALYELTNTIIPTTMVGAYPRPSWYTLSFSGRDIRSALMDARANEQYQDAVKLVIKEQELAGLDVLTDGDMRFDNWVGGVGGFLDPVSRLGGIEWSSQPSNLVKNLSMPMASPILRETIWEKINYAAAIRKLDRGTLQFADFWRIAQRFTEMPIRHTGAGPNLCMLGLVNHHYKDDHEMYIELCKIYNQEYVELAKAGCKVIQTDYPLWPAFYRPSVYGEDEWKRKVEGFNIEVKGVEAQIWTHVCWGRSQNQLSTGSIGSFESFLSHFADLKADVIGPMEAASTKGLNLEKELKVYKEYCSDRDIMLGVVNHRTTIVETPGEVADIIRIALKYVEPDRLGVSTDCGLPALSRPIAYYKLKSVVEGAKIVRNEIQGKA